MALVCSARSSLGTSRLTPAARLSGPGVTAKIGEVILLQVLSMNDESMTKERRKPCYSALLFESRLLILRLLMPYRRRCSECGLPLRGPRRSKQPPKAESTNSAFINLRINKQYSDSEYVLRHSFVFRISSFFRHWSFGIRHFDSEHTQKRMNLY